MATGTTRYRQEYRMSLDTQNWKGYFATMPKDHAVVREDTGAAVVRLDIRWGAPRRLVHLTVPGFERYFRVPMRRVLPEFPQGTLGNDPHGLGFSAPTRRHAGVLSLCRAGASAPAPNAPHW